MWRQLHSHRSVIHGILLGLLIPLGSLAAIDSSETNTPVAKALEKADKLFKEQNWAEARAAYDEARKLEPDWPNHTVRQAVEGAVACSVKLSQWDDALSRAQEFVTRTKGHLEEPIGERFLGGLYLTVPHYGTKRGTTFLRGQWTQGVQVYSYRKDNQEALKHYERARELLLHFPAKTSAEREAVNAERIGLDFDLATALSTGGSSRRYYWAQNFWWWWGDTLDSEEDSQAVDEADYEETRWGWNRWEENQETPIGIPLGPDGKPQFIEVPKAYSADLGAGQKIRYLLAEIQQLDTSTNKDAAARALFRWAMIARTLYGPDSASGYGNAQVRYDRFGHPLPSEPDANEPKKKIWELTDDEAITLAGGKRRLITLPASESPIALLREVETKYPQSEIRGEAHYARALYFQTRQQFPEAVKEYQSFLEHYPDHKRTADVREQLRRINQADITLNSTGIFLPGTPPTLSFSYRNTDSISLKALRFDLAKYIQDSMEARPTNNWWEYRNLDYYFFQNERWKKYVGGEVKQWTEAVPREQGNRVAEGKTTAPLMDPGAYLIEASVSGKGEPARVLMFISDIALLHKNVNGNGLLYVCDAVTGQPLPEKVVRLYEHWTVYNQKDQRQDCFWDSTTQKTDTNGVILYSRKHADHGSQVDAITFGESNRMAFSFFQNWNESAYQNGEYWENGPRYYLITDRPVYRPGSTVHFRLWVRQIRDRDYESPSGGQRVRVEIYDAKNNSAKNLELTTDDLGGASGEYTLGDEPPLGVWQMRINSEYPESHRNAGALFRVEEYKKPEFEVSVQPAKSQARLGEKIKATIAAQYYFRAPVVNATVSYKIFREDYHHVFFGPGEYDWLYGPGYGRYYYPYPWFAWWNRWGDFIYSPYGPYLSHTAYLPWGYYNGYGDWRNRYESGTRKALRELVAKGEGRLKTNGTFEVEIDTSDAKATLGDRDHRYTVEAEVRDESRRIIQGAGSVLATRQEFYAYVETDRGWYTGAGDALVEVRTMRPDNLPVAASGEVLVKRISYRDDAANAPEETIVKQWDAETDADGRLSFHYVIPSEGQYRITFVTHDSTKTEVQGNAVFWVNGPHFDGHVYRFNDLEIIADKRTYQPGETAHLLINVAQDNSRILFADQVSQGVLLNWRFIDVPSRSMVIDLPIEAKHVPNFFVEATLVRSGRIHTEARELFVPPTQGLLNVQITSDKAIYQPGETGRVSVAVTDMNGHPAQGQVTLTAYDKSVTYIQDEFGPGPRVFFHGQTRYHSPQTSFSGDQTFQNAGTFERPEWYVSQGGEPEGWRGWWGLDQSGLSLDFARNGIVTAGSFAIGGGGGGSDRIALRESLRAITAPASVLGDLPLAGKLLGTTERQKFDGFVGDGDGKSSAAMIEPEVRVNFADTAFWLPSLTLNSEGKADSEVRFPQSLTTWRLHAYALTAATQVGDSTNEVVTTKNLLVRLEAPRFFVERDEVVLSANVHNYLAKEKRVRAELILPADLFEPLTEDSSSVQRKGNELHLNANAAVPSKGEHRFDWPVRVKKAGLAQITAKAMTDQESDGMRLAFPVLVHGVDKTVAQNGSYRVDKEGMRTLEVNVPRAVDPEQTRLEVTLSPSLAGVLIDALPYLAGYPYGCVEQTMSRFYPSVLVKNTLKKMGTDLETIGKQRKQMNAGDITNRFGRWNSPVFDSAELDRMVHAGLDRIYSLQRNDGGWGWWREDDSSPYQTAYVLQGLRAARDTGVNVDGGVFERALQYLQNATEKELAKPKDQQQLGALQTQVYIAYILSCEQRLNNDDLKKWFDHIYEQRGELNNYGRALLALALHNEKRADDAKLVLQNILQFVERDDSNETAWVRTPENYWWFWWNNDIEANAWALKAIVTIDPQNELAPRLVKWLLNNRRNGYYWRSTRDTALVIAAMTDYMQACGEAAPDYSIALSMDGKPVKDIKVTKENFFTFDNRFVLYGLQLKPGPHKITLNKHGQGALYYSAYVSYFTKEEDVKGAGNEIFVQRDYFKLVPSTEKVIKPKAVNSYSGAAHPANEAKPASATGHPELRDSYIRIPLKNGDAVKSGDQIEVVLKITAKNTYDYLAFEDMKPAGCEPVELRSGGRWAGGLCANLELRDEKVVFFIGLLEQGEHVLRYKLRAETPGHFHALPAKGFAMYAPEVKAISDEMRLRIADEKN